MSLIFKDVQKAFGKVVALEAINFEVEHGEIRGILGGNGSGKSTLTKILGGMVSKDKGEITLDGENCYFKSTKEAKKRRIIITSQELSLLHNLSIAENLCLCELPAKGLFADKRKAYEIAKNALARFELEHLLEKNVSELAPNEKYMVELTKALIQEPEILIVDEITSALYRKDVEKVDRALKELKDKGCIILFITHRMPELYTICDSVTVVRNGVTVETLKMTEASEEQLLSYMTGRDITAAAGKQEDPAEPEEENRENILEVSGMNLQGFEGSVSFTLKKGEIVGVAGLQGHGQATLVRQLFGLLGPVRYKYDGSEKTYHNVTQAVKGGLAFVSGDRVNEGAFGERSLAENARAVSHVTLKGPKRDVNGLFQQFNVKYHNDRQSILELSGGNQQKVILARWTDVKPKVFLADDPTKGIDVQARREVHQILYQLADEGTAVLMVSSDDEELVELTKNAKLSKILVMYEGKISAVLSGDKITEDNISLASMNMYREV